MIFFRLLPDNAAGAHQGRDILLVVRFGGNGDESRAYRNPDPARARVVHQTPYAKAEGAIG